MAVSGEAFPVEPVSRRAAGPLKGGEATGGDAASAGASRAGGKPGGPRSGAGSDGAGSDGATGVAGVSASHAAAAPTAKESQLTASAGSEPGSTSTRWLVAAGVLALLAVVWLGWLRYRRRLP